MESTAGLVLGLKGMIDNGQISEHDKFIGQQIATILSGGETDMLNEVDEDHILKLESNSIQSRSEAAKTDTKSIAPVNSLISPSKGPT